MKIIKTFAVLFLVLPTLAFAHGYTYTDTYTYTPRVDQRQAEQQHRINQGVASGRLTQREAFRLQRGQQHINDMEYRAKADGVVTRWERARLHEAQDIQSRRIYNQKHDRQYDFNHNGRIDRPSHY